MEIAILAITLINLGMNLRLTHKLNKMNKGVDLSQEDRWVTDHTAVIHDARERLPHVHNP
jgi:hypothetical protein